MNRYVRPVMFAFEPDVVSVYALISFGAAGAPTLNTNYSKGVCNIARNTVSFTGDTTNSSAAVATISSYNRLYKGMTVTGTGIPASTTISSFTVGSDTLTLSQAATASNTGVALTAAGGQYTITFGAQFSPARFDPYVRLLGIYHSWDESGTPGSASVGAITPGAPSMFLIQNNISSSTLANLVLQFGSYSNSTFTAADPGNGDQLRICFQFTRSTAV